jgi:hypothetical protein
MLGNILAKLHQFLYWLQTLSCDVSATGDLQVLQRIFQHWQIGDPVIGQIATFVEDYLFHIS